MLNKPLLVTIIPPPNTAMNLKKSQLTCHSERLVGWLDGRLSQRRVVLLTMKVGFFFIRQQLKLHRYYGSKVLCRHTRKSAARTAFEHASDHFDMHATLCHANAASRIDRIPCINTCVPGSWPFGGSLIDRLIFSTLISEPCLTS